MKNCIRCVDALIGIFNTVAVDADRFLNDDHNFDKGHNSVCNFVSITSNTFYKANIDFPNFFGFGCDKGVN